MKKTFYIFDKVTNGDWGQSSINKIRQPREGFITEDEAEAFIDQGLIDKTIHLNPGDYLLIIKCYIKS